MNLLDKITVTDIRKMFPFSAVRISGKSKNAALPPQM